jgi:hypothetical protein
MPLRRVWNVVEVCIQTRRAGSRFVPIMVARTSSRLANSSDQAIVTRCNRQGAICVGRVGVWRHIDAIEGVRHEADCDTTVPAGRGAEKAERSKTMDAMLHAVICVAGCNEVWQATSPYRLYRAS